MDFFESLTEPGYPKFGEISKKTFIVLEGKLPQISFKID
jgi:hypothetical protein